MGPSVFVGVEFLQVQGFRVGRRTPTNTPGIGLVGVPVGVPALNHVVVSPSPLSAQTAGEYEHLARRDYTCATGPTPPAHDFVPAIGLQAAYSRKVPWWPPVRRRGVETSALQPSHSPDSPLRDFVPTIGLQTAYSQMVPGWSPARRGVSTLLRYTSATGHLGVDLVGAQSVTVRAVTRDHSEAPQYHVLPTDDAEAVVDIMRAAAGLPPLSDEPDK